MRQISDPFFRLVTLRSTESPQCLVYQALRQDYSEGDVAGPFTLAESEYGERCIKNLLANDKGHYGPMEHPQISFNAIGFPHDVAMQARTHRIGVSFDIQSSRYSGQRFCDVSDGIRSVEEVFYARPVGKYADREGNKVMYSEGMRREDLAFALASCNLYSRRLEQGVPPEAARHVVVQGFRQNFVMSANLRSALHFLDLRSKADAQPEIQAMADLMFDELKIWCPEIVSWYETRRLKKAILAP